MLQAAGDSGEASNFSKWSFSYTEALQLIKQGENEIAANISCIEDGESNLKSFPDGSAPGDTTALGTPLNEWHTVNVTGVTGAPPVAVTSSEDSGDTESGSDDESDGSDGSNGDDELDGWK